MPLREQVRRRFPIVVSAAKRLPLVESWLDRHPPSEPEVERVIQAYVKRGHTVADVGAHRGTLTQLLATLVSPEGQVFAFEANPDNAAALRTMFADRRHVTVEHAAVSDTPGCLDLFPGRGRRSAEWSIVDLHGVGNPIQVPAITLNSYFADSRPSFLKIDVEGAEANVLLGMSQLLREDRPILLVEFHSVGGADAIDVLHQFGYRIQNVATGEIVSTNPPGYFHGLATASD